MQTAARAISTFQKFYRKQKKIDEEEKENERMLKTKKQVNEKRRRKTFVESKEKQLKVGTQAISLDNILS